MMIEGIKAALDFPHDPRRLRFVSFLTDGYIGNETEILGEIHQRLGDARIFSFGVGSSVNRYLLDRMAKLGKGAVAYLGLNDSGTRGHGPLLRPHQPPGPDGRADRLGRHGGLGGLPAPESRTCSSAGRSSSPAASRARRARRSASPAESANPRRKSASRSSSTARPRRIRASPASGPASRSRTWRAQCHLRHELRPARRDQAGRPRVRPDVRLHRLRRGRFHARPPPATTA